MDTICRNCGGAHHIQKCAEILDLLFAPDDGSPTSNDIGPDPEPGRALFRWRGTAREWLAQQNTARYGVR